MLGCWLGLAIGDALGAPVQFRTRDNFDPVTGYRAGGVYNIDAGYWTDDTSMALCLAETLVEHGDYIAQDYGERLIRWVEGGYNSSLDKCFDIGQTTLRAIGEIKRSSFASSGMTEEMSCGNGSIMRLAPIPIYFSNNLQKAITLSVAQSSITHNHPVVLSGCKLLCELILSAFESQNKMQMLDVLNQTKLHSKYNHICNADFKDKSRHEIDSGTYVISTLEAALWSIWNSDSFEEAMLLAVNLGHDADTVGAVTGQLAGALYGKENIPQKWIDDLYDSERIQMLGNKLSQ